MKEKQYRDGYVAAQISLGLPTKIRALRLERKWTQGDLAQRAKMAQPRISEIETPGERKLNLDTLQRLASAFDVGPEVDFVPFGKLISRSEGFDPDSFSVQSFEPELAAATEAARLTTESQTGLLTGLTLDLYEKFASAFKEGVETVRRLSLLGNTGLIGLTGLTNVEPIGTIPTNAVQSEIQAVAPRSFADSLLPPRERFNCKKAAKRHKRGPGYHRSAARYPIAKRRQRTI